MRVQPWSRKYSMQSAIQFDVLLDRDGHVHQHRRTPGPGDREQIGEAGDLESEVRARAVRPHVGQSNAVRPRMSMRSSEPVIASNPGREHERVELVLARRRSQAVRRDDFDGRPLMSTRVTLSRLNVS